EPGEQGAPRLGEQQRREENRSGNRSDDSPEPRRRAELSNGERQTHGEEGGLGVVIADRPLERPLVEPAWHDARPREAVQNLDRLRDETGEHAEYERIGKSGPGERTDEQREGAEKSLVQRGPCPFRDSSPGDRNRHPASEGRQQSGCRQ